MSLRGLHANLACVWEATARKPGNVHRFKDFSDTHYLDFVASAAAIAPVMAEAGQLSVGEILTRGQAMTRLVTRRNTNLGILLLLAPLAKAEAGSDYQAHVEEVLASLTPEDAEAAYAVIRSAQAGGLGEVPEADVREKPTVSLRDAMRLAASRDMVARQYATGFTEVFAELAPALLDGIERTGSLEGGIVVAHLAMMAAHPDSLIARKRGIAEARQAAQMAQRVVDLAWPDTYEAIRQLEQLDAWLRAEGHARNPGTTADLLAAGLFVLLRQGRLHPGKHPWEQPRGLAGVSS
ncbi:MAG: triphosphoribosyl-dephospho-CoA synthase [Gemmataceae bacterium]